MRYTRQILDHIAHDDYTPRGVEALARDLRAEDVEAFRAEVLRLADEGLVEVSAAGHIALPSLADRGGEVVGRFRANERGFGFVIPERAAREGDIFIPPGARGDALTGDLVRVRLERDRRRGSYNGEVVEVIERKRVHFTGEVARQGALWLVHPDGRELTTPIVVRDAPSKNAKPGDKAVVEILEYPEGSTLAEGVIVRILGPSGEPDVETQAVIAAYGLPGEFPGRCHEEARAVTRRFEGELREGGAGVERRDLREELILTIDPPDAKDYDDAISIRRTAGGWDLGVHIADVSHFVEPGSALDEEARARGTSVYLPRLVIPMLPEMLSNGICSLQEGVDRFCKSAFMSYARDGTIRAEGVASTVIRSAKRLTYLEAQALIDGDEEGARRHARAEPRYTPEVVAALKEMDALARAIRERRRRGGMISLELPEVVLLFDETGRVVDAEREDDAFTHTLIEMFMVEANEVLARLFERLDVPLLRRTHPPPTPGDTEGVRRIAKVAGFSIPSNPTREELQALLDGTRGTPAAPAVHMAVLRTLSRAEYSPAAVGHFALASGAYAHFTSPIRRYPDLTVHRALAEYLSHTANGTARPASDGDRKRLGKVLRESGACPSHEELVALGRHCTMREQVAEEAERSLRQFLVLQLMSRHIGEVFGGIVTGITGRGAFVQVDKYLAEGLIKLGEGWRHDPKTGTLHDPRTGRSLAMGNRVQVRIAQVDLSRRQMDLALEAGEGPARAGAAKPAAGSKPGAPGQAAGGAGPFRPRKEKTGTQRRSQKSKARDKGKKRYR